MADDTEQLLIAVKSDVNDAIRNFDLVTRTATQKFAEIQRSADTNNQRLQRSFRESTANINRELDGIGKGVDFGGIGRGALGSITSLLGIEKLREAADGWTNLGNKIKAVGEDEGRVGDRLSQLADVALKSRASLESIGGLYASLRRASEELGANQAQVLRVTETVSKALANSGATTQETAAAVLQLGQAIGSGTLQGDELRSILENAPALAKVIAKEFDTTVAGLKQLGSDGELTSDRVFKAILKGSAEVDAAFAKTIPTISQAFTNLSTATQRYIGQIDQANGFSRTFAQGIQGIADNANTTLPIIAALGVGLSAAFFGGPLAGGVSAVGTAFALLGDQIRPIQGEIATLADYSKAAFDIIKNSSADVLTAFGPSFITAIDGMTNALSNTEREFEGFGAVVKPILNGIIQAFVDASSAITVAWNGLGSALAEIIIESMNAVVRAVQAAINGIIGAVNSLGSGVNALGGKVGVDLGIGKIADVDLGKISNTYSGAGKELGKAFGETFAKETKDYVGDAYLSVDVAFNKTRTKANELAADRAEQARRDSALRSQQRASDGSLDQALKPPKKEADDAKGGGKGAKENAFDKEVEASQARVRQLEQETAAVGKSTAEAAKSAEAFKLLESAKKAGLPIDDELRGKVDALATAYSNAKVALDKAQQAQTQFKDFQTFVGTSLSGFFSDIVSGGKNASEALSNFVKKLADAALQAALLGSGPLAGLFGTASADKNSVGGIVGALFKGVGSTGTAATAGTGFSLSSLFGFADGGQIHGPGTTRSDSIPVMVSDKEFIVNADATAKHLDLLHAINSGKLPRFAEGGLVSAPSFGQPITPVNRSATQTITLAPTINVNATGGKSADNADLAKKIGAQVRDEMRGLMSEEIRNQLRPGNVLNPV